MALVNLRNRSIQAKIVYYGPGWGGKTTNLEFIHRALSSRARSDLMTINTQGDRTIFFDFLPLEFAKVKGFDLNIQLYTVPGQVKYAATRRLVLNGADGVVFVADSRESRRQHNLESLEDLRKNLTTYHRDIESFPLVIQFNKRDLEGSDEPIMDERVMFMDLNDTLGAPVLSSSAATGERVLDTLKLVIRDTVRSLRHVTG